jgi:hypothetical protein
MLAPWSVHTHRHQTPLERREVSANANRKVKLLLPQNVSGYWRQARLETAGKETKRAADMHNGPQLQDKQGKEGWELRIQNRLSASKEGIASEMERNAYSLVPTGPSTYKKVL